MIEGPRDVGHLSTPEARGRGVALRQGFQVRDASCLLHVMMCEGVKVSSSTVIISSSNLFVPAWQMLILPPKCLPACL